MERRFPPRFAERNVYNCVKEITDILKAFEGRRGEPLALATLVRARGSSYRRPGARMLITADGRTVGALSGGCLEEEVAVRAREVFATGQPLLLQFRHPPPLRLQRRDRSPGRNGGPRIARATRRRAARPSRMPHRHHFRKQRTR